MLLINVTSIEKKKAEKQEAHEPTHTSTEDNAPLEAGITFNGRVGRCEGPDLGIGPEKWTHVNTSTKDPNHRGPDMRWVHGPARVAEPQHPAEAQGSILGPVRTGAAASG